MTNKINHVTFDIFKNLDFIKHGFSTKQGGVSTGVFESLNLGFNRGDDDNKVMQNFKIISDSIGFDYKNIVMAVQMHNTNICNVDETHRGLGILTKTTLDNTDGLMTNEKDVVLTTYYADCVPLFFVDTKKHVIALSHAGWRGTVNKIAEKTITKMINDYNSSLDDILVGIAPSICKNCFEVDKPVYEEFKKLLYFADDYITKISDKYYIDLQNINKRILIDAGINKNNIEITNYCTKCNSDIFYSHRQNGTQRGSLAAFLTLCK